MCLTSVTRDDKTSPALLWGVQQKGESDGQGRSQGHGDTDHERLWEAGGLAVREVVPPVLKGFVAASAAV